MTYNTFLYNTSLYNSGGPLETEDGIIVDKWISIFYKRFFPQWIENQYPEFLDFFKYWLEYLEQAKNPYWILAHLLELFDVDLTLDEFLTKFREKLAPDFIFEYIPDIDKRKLLSNIKSFYAKKGNEESFQYLFRMLGHEIEIFHPIDETLFVGDDSTIGDQHIQDSFYWTFYTYDIRVDMPYDQWNRFIRPLAHPAGVQLFGTFVHFGASGLLELIPINLVLPTTYPLYTHLNGNLTSGDTNPIDVLDDDLDYFGTDDFPSSGTLRIDNENITYSGKTDSTFTGITRGAVQKYYNTADVTHTDISDFTVNTDNDYIQLSTRLNWYTGKKVNLSTTTTLPTPLTSTDDYYVKLKEVTGLLDGGITAVQTVILVTNIDEFPDSGTIKINGEYITYGSKTSTALNVSARGALSSSASAHNDGDKVYVYDRLVQLTPTKLDANNGTNIIDITDTGTGTHTATGEGVEVGLYTGFQLIFPADILFRELNIFTSLLDIDNNIGSELEFKLSYSQAISSVNTGTDEITFGATHSFALGQRVYLEPTASDFLDGAITDSDTTISLLDSTGFPASGTIRIGAEIITYAGVSVNDLTGCTRGTNGTTATAHLDKTNVRTLLPLTTGSQELNSKYYIDRVSSTVVKLASDLNDIAGSTIDLVSSGTGNWTMVIDEIKGHALYSGNPLISPLPESLLIQNVSGATGRITGVDGRHMIVQPLSGTFDDTNTVYAQTAGLDVYTWTVDRLFTTLGDYTLVDHDMPDYTFEDFENATDDDYPYDLLVKKPQIRKEGEFSINARMVIPTMNNAVENDTNWAADTVTAIGSFNANTIGHVTQASTGATGIVRGYHIEEENVVTDSGTTYNYLSVSTTTILITLDAPPTNSSGYMKLNDEIIYYPSYSLLSGNVYRFFNVTRASQSTTAQIHQIGTVADFILLTSSNSKIPSIEVASGDFNFDGTVLGNPITTTIGASGLLKESITDSATTLELKSGYDDFPSGASTIQIGNEVITYTSRSGDTFSGLTRGQSGTSASVHYSDSVVSGISTLTRSAGSFVTDSVTTDSILLINGIYYTVLTVAALTVTATSSDSLGDYNSVYVSSDVELLDVLTVGDGGSSGNSPAYIISGKYGLRCDTPQTFIKPTLLSEIASTDNWSADTATAIGSFNANNKGHVSQSVSNAQGIVRYRKDAENAVTAIVGTSDTTINVTSTTGFASSGKIKINNEIIYYTSTTATTFTVPSAVAGEGRGMNDTIPDTHANGSIVQSYVNDDFDNKECYIEVASGTFVNDASYVLSVGNNTASGNDQRVISSLETITRIDPQNGEYFIVSGTDSSDPNAYILYNINNVYNDASFTEIHFDEVFSDPVSTIGDINLLLY